MHARVGADAGRDGKRQQSVVFSAYPGASAGPVWDSDS